MTNGLIIAVDGPGGAGKTTLIKELAARLTGGGVPVLATTEPTRSSLGDFVRAHTKEFHGLTLACLVAADRYNHLENEVRPAAAAGRVVLCDRYTLSSLVLQAGIDGVPELFVRSINAYAEPPDLQIILTAPPDVLRDRVALRGSHGRFEDDPTLPEREVTLYEQAASASDRAGVRTIVADTSGSPAETESLLSKLSSTIQALWSHRPQEPTA